MTRRRNIGKAVRPESLPQEADVLLRDRSLARRLQHPHKMPDPRRRDKGVARLQKSAAILAARASAEADINCPPDLPIAKRLDTIAATIRSNQVTIVCGGTGSGKSTQVPKVCLSLGYGMAGQIGHTQPRRVAARSVAARLASETGTEFGQLVGCQVRFGRDVAPHSRVKLMTDGILLEEIRNDRLLWNYDALIIDEVHERTCNIDFTLGYLAKILPERPALRLIFMSATVDYEAIQRLFSAAVVEVPGNSFPVEISYRPFDAESTATTEAVDSALTELDAGGDEDVLVFFPGEREIRDAERYLRGRGFDDTDFLPLYGRMEPAEQEIVFRSHERRRVILATNVAETSITIPGVRHVIDTGTARISAYNPRSKLQELPTAEISQASATQRAGRCGREAPGRCIRLYSEDNFLQRDPQTLPEIRRTSLAQTILRCEYLKLGHLSEFPLPDPPDDRQLRDGYNLLREIGAVDDNKRITGIGKQLARLPLDPRIGRFVIAANENGCLREALTIASALSVGELRLRPLEASDEADVQHQAFSDHRSDLQFYLNLKQFVDDELASLSRNQQRRQLQARFLSYRRIRDWQELEALLMRICRDLGFKPNEKEAKFRDIHVAFLHGFAGLVGRRRPDGEYTGARGKRFRIHPGSGLFSKPPKFLVATEVVETTARYARHVASIDSGWVTKAAPHLIKRTHSRPYWDGRRGRAFTFETQRLFGIELQSDQRVGLARIDPDGARRLLIERGLIDGELAREPAFVAANAQLRKSLRHLEVRMRRTIAPHDSDLFRHYDERLPTGVVTFKSLEQWLSAVPTADKSMRLEPSDFLPSEFGDPTAAAQAYPEAIEYAGMHFPVSYRFEPDTELDGIIVDVPRAALDRLGNDAFDSLVPGFLTDKVSAAVRSLPKATRKKVHPLANFVEATIGRLKDSAISLEQALREQYYEVADEMPPSDWLGALSTEAHHVAHIRVLDDAGKATGIYRSLAAAKSACSAAEPSAAVVPKIYRKWAFGDLAKQVSREVGTTVLRDYVGLCDMSDGVIVEHYATSTDADDNHLHGLARLIALNGNRAERRTRAVFSDNTLMMSAVLGLSSNDLQSLYKAAVASVLAKHHCDALPRDEMSFIDVCANTKLPAKVLHENLADAFAPLIEAAFHLYRHIGNQIAQRWPERAQGFRAHLMRLFDPAMIPFCEVDWLTAYPRYLNGLQRRVERFSLNPTKDEAKISTLVPLDAMWDRGVANSRIAASRRYDLRLAIEEAYLTQFAPELARRSAISLKQITRQLQELVIMN